MLRYNIIPGISLRMGIPLPKDAWIKDKIITMASIVMSEEFNYALFSNEQIITNLTRTKYVVH